MPSQNAPVCRSPAASLAARADRFALSFSQDFEAMPAGNRAFERVRGGL